MNTAPPVIRRALLLLAGSLALSATARAAPPPLLPGPDISALAEEISGEAAKRNLEFLSLHHRMRASREFHRTTDYIAHKLADYGLEQVEILKFPADGKTMYGTQKARLAWDADFAELWDSKQTEDGWQRTTRLASWDTMPLSLADESESAAVIADLVDVGRGVSAADYDGKSVRGKLVLAGAQPGPVAALAVAKYGALGIVSYAQNQKTAWWGDDDNLVRWGHLDSFSKSETFAFMVSLKVARGLQARLARGERVRLDAKVEAGQHSGFYEIATAVIAGADVSLKDHEIAFTCHLDHPRPGANDNASGCATILEVARTLAKLIADGKIERPARTIRFYWPAEIEGTTALLNARPKLAARLSAVIHMDMVGGGPVTKAIFRVSRPPASVASFVGDVGEAFGQFVNNQSEAFASGEPAAYPLVAPEGGKEELAAILGRFSMGSDHQVFADGAFKVPFIYLHDWPDRYIHTNFDSAANIDPTKLKRAGFIGAASALFLAAMDSGDVVPLWQVIQGQSLRRAADMVARRAELGDAEAANLSRHHWAGERAAFASLSQFAAVPKALADEAAAFYDRLAAATGTAGPMPAAGDATVYQRKGPAKGPMRVFGYDYLADHLGADKAAGLELLSYRGPWGGGSEYAYEALNFVDGKRSAGDIRDALSAEFGPVPGAMVDAYLQALATIGVIAPVK